MKRLSYILATLLSLFVLSCEESLPPYVEPRNILSAALTFESRDTIPIFWDPVSKSYSMGDQLIYKLTVTNLFDDLLQGEALIDGMIDARSFSDIPRVLRVPLKQGDMRQPPVFQGNIALGPNAKAEFTTLWLPMALDGKFVWEGLPSVTIDNDKLYGPIRFQVTAKMQIFERIQATQSNQISFQLYFREKTL